MSVCLLFKDYQTNYCRFSYDTWAEDGHKLPNMTTRGKEGLSNILSCSQGSIAISTSDGGENRILTGKNQWVTYSGNAGGGGGGGSDNPDSGNGFIEL